MRHTKIVPEGCQLAFFTGLVWPLSSVILVVSSKLTNLTVTSLINTVNTFKFDCKSIIKILLRDDSSPPLLWIQRNTSDRGPRRPNDRIKHLRIFLLIASHRRILRARKPGFTLLQNQFLSKRKALKRYTRTSAAIHVTPSSASTAVSGSKSEPLAVFQTRTRASQPPVYIVLVKSSNLRIQTIGRWEGYIRSICWEC